MLTRKILYLSFVLFYLSIIAFWGLALFEAKEFSGYITASFNISLKQLFCLIVVLGLVEEIALFKILKQKKQDSTTIFFLQSRAYLYYINAIALVILLILDSIFIFVKKGVYIDFVKISLGLNPTYLLHLIGLSIFLFILGKVLPIKSPSINKKDIVNLFTKESLKICLIMVLVISSVIFFYGGTLNWWFKGLTEKPFANYDQKMHYVYGSFYNYMKFVNSNTPSNAVIMRMKQDSKWPWLSNDPFTRYFIYPRYTKEGDKNSFTDPSIKYVFVHKQYPDANDPGAGERWPDFKVPAKRVLYMRDNDFTKEPIIVNGDYNPKDKTYEKLWGLIEMKRN